MLRIFFRAMQIFALVGMPGFAHAGQSGQFLCVHSHIEYSGEGSVYVCDTYELRVHITTDGDAGRPGAFGIGVQLQNGGMAYWSIANGWQESIAGEALPVDGYYDALPASRDYVVYHGSLAGMCVHGSNFNVGAGYGALQPDRAAQINALMAHPNVKISVEHMRDTFIRMDGMQGNKWGVVYDGRDCTPPTNNGGG